MAAISPPAPAAATTERRAVIALSLPIVIPSLMMTVFNVAHGLLGDNPGYLVGFVVYWLTCLLVAVAILGPRQLAGLFRGTRPRLGRPAALGAILIGWPVLGAVATRFIPEVGGATSAELATVAAAAVVNAVVEEVFWRGVFISLWPSDPVRGWLWPAVGFAIWHLAPQAIHPSSLGVVPFVLASLAVGLSFGWVAWRSGTLRWVTAAHVLTDGSGIRSALYFLP